MARLLRALVLAPLGLLLAACGLAGGQWQAGEPAADETWSTTATEATEEPVAESGGLTRAQVREELTGLGYPGKAADCLLDDLERQGIDISQYALEDFAGAGADLYEAARTAGMACAEHMDADSYDAVLGDDPFAHPQVREEFVRGLMLDPQVDRTLAECVVERLVEIDADVSAFLAAKPGDPALDPVIEAFQHCEVAAG
ncbi:hypothetical protein KUV85_15875 [Nocardioides panacisoli]|uniref:hypothetical protein n=1 Tax=Nocardioides panacisoli TaxID=627624 RepID=UPI001C6302EA|nr:hypothetical protein [Nocardioides panacisoli]QYJ03785.1 hypothetical protein KUV85_15875 [Nocardioides panacisoli]